MKTRIIHTKIWSDDWFCSLSRASAVIFLYLLSCPENNISGLFEMSDRVIAFNTRSTQIEVEKSKEELKPRVIFYKGWVKLANTTKYNNYVTNDKMVVALNKELKLVPEEIRKYMEGYDTSIDTSIYTPNNNKSEIRNKKREERVKREEVKTYEELYPLLTQPIKAKYSQEFLIELSEVDRIWKKMLTSRLSHNKPYTNWTLALRNWIEPEVREGKVKKIAGAQRPLTGVAAVLAAKERQYGG